MVDIKTYCGHILFYLHSFTNCAFKIIKGRSKMKKENSLLTWLKICIVSVLFIMLFSMLFCSGCHSGNIVSNGHNLLPAPTPQQQLWNAAKKSNWLVTVSILGMAAGFFAFLNGSKLGIPCIGASGISLFMALAVARFAVWMAVFGLIGSVCATLVSVLVKKKALSEIIQGFQYVKNELIPKKKRSEANQIMAEAQKNKSTKKVVQNVKTSLKLKGSI